MSCEMTESLQSSLINHPRLLKSKQWKKHLKNCSVCFQEATLLDKTLELYLQLEKSSLKFLPEVQIWENIKYKTTKTPIPYWKWGSSFAAAAIVVLIIIALLPSQHTQVKGMLVSTLPSGFKVEKIQMGQPFGPPSSQTQFTWTQDHFGISIDNKLNGGNFSKISIGSGKQDGLASYYFPPQKNNLQLAFLNPPEMP